MSVISHRSQLEMGPWYSDGSMSVFKKNQYAMFYVKIAAILIMSTIFVLLVCVSLQCLFSVDF